MQITHPGTYWNGIAPENVFIVTEDTGVQIGTGYAIYQYLPHLYPDRPVNIFFQTEGMRSARDMLFGALVARARQLRDSAPGEQARIYTCIPPEDLESADFFTHSGMNCSEQEIRLHLAIPEGTVHLPMGCSTEETPLYLPAQQLAFLERMQRNDVTHIDASYLMELMRTAHFHAAGLFSGGQLAGEIMVAGSGPQAEIMAFYVMPAFRRKGLGTILCRWALWALSQEGVTECGARFVTRSLPQKALAKTLGVGEGEVTAVFPQLFM